MGKVDELKEIREKRTQNHGHHEHTKFIQFQCKMLMHSLTLEQTAFHDVVPATAFKIQGFGVI